jgi:hypothetical protein
MAWRAVKAGGMPGAQLGREISRPLTRAAKRTHHAAAGGDADDSDAAAEAPTPPRTRARTAAAARSLLSLGGERDDIPVGSERADMGDEEVADDEKVTAADELLASGTDDEDSGGDADSEQSDEGSDTDSESESKEEKKSERKRSDDSKETKSAEREIKREKKGDVEVVMKSGHEHKLKKRRTPPGTKQQCSSCGAKQTQLFMCVSDDGDEKCDYRVCAKCAKPSKRKAVKGKEEDVKWSKTVQPPKPLHRYDGVATPLEGMPTDPLRLFLLFIPMTLIELMVTNTNKYARLPNDKRTVQSYPVSAFLLFLFSMKCNFYLMRLRAWLVMLM